jgi:hypothetical protein
MKATTRLILALTLILPFASFAAESVNLNSVECYGVEFNHKKSAQPEYVSLSKEDQQYHVVLSGKKNGNNYKVVIEKSSHKVNGAITLADGLQYNFVGGFASGRVEFTAMSGGNNLPSPANLIGLSCVAE